jgi:8-oxo-dGTP diphosphatase
MPTPVVCAVISKDNLFLACRRDRRKTQGGLWEFPGGKVHSDESPQDALKREIDEELGVQIEVGDFVAKTTYAYDHGSIELTAYRCAIVSGILKPTEHEEIRWVTLAEAAPLEWAPADVPILEKIHGMGWTGFFVET